jgi:hypothetical protein
MINRHVNEKVEIAALHVLPSGRRTKKTNVARAVLESKLEDSLPVTANGPLT